MRSLRASPEIESTRARGYDDRVVKFEREVKLAVTLDYHLPSPYGVASGLIVRRLVPERLCTMYLDTDDFRVARWGASLRHHPGEGWTVMLPAEPNARVLAPPEITVAGHGAQARAQALELVCAFTRGAGLRTQTQLSTLRQRSTLHDVDGKLIAAVVDDVVSVLEGRRSTPGFREVEVQIGADASPELLGSLVGRLGLSGAAPREPTPKYIRALGVESELRPEIRVPELTGDAAAGDIARRAIALSVIRLIRHDPVMRLDENPEGVHQARVATRRLRSDLRTFASLVEATWAACLRDELGWLAKLLGAVRDGDVLLERLRRRAARLPEREQPGAIVALASLQSAREEAHADLLAALRSYRYGALVDRLVEAANTPALARKARTPARALLPRLVRRPWRSLARYVHALGSPPTDTDLHRVRIRTKRVRYAAEAVAPVVGDDAWAFARTAARMQKILGDLNDAVVAEGWLHERGRDESRPEVVRAAAAMAAAERAAAAHSRTRWEKAWKELASPKLREWM
jgi:CHAD domain-containing protein